MKRKGFTLVELLGVIVVLAIIALIAVPVIIGVIDKSRKGALQSSANGLIDAGILYHAEYQNSNIARFDIKNNEVTSKEENKLTYKGNIKAGTVLVNSNGEVTICINDGKYAAYKNFKDNRVTVIGSKTCNIPENSSVVYLDNESTVDTNIETLMNEIENLKSETNLLKQEIANLKEEKSNKSEVTNSINNLATTHTSDLTTLNNRLGNVDITSIGNGTITSALSNLDARMLVKEGITKPLTEVNPDIDNLYLEGAVEYELNVFNYVNNNGGFHILLHTHYHYDESGVYYGTQLDMNVSLGLRYRTLNANKWSAWKTIG